MTLPEMDEKMGAIQAKSPSQPARSSYDEKLSLVIARHSDFQQDLQKLVAYWEAERSQLKTRIVHLEHSLVELIERSSNPLRANQREEEKLRLIEEAKREWNAQWSAERRQLLDEVNRLRRIAKG
jgi:hypothetical protein